MGKLTHKLREVSQTSGSGMGFFGRPRAGAQRARPAGVLVALGAGDVAAAEAAAHAGVDAVLVTGWAASGGTKLRDALASTSTLWGVTLDAKGAAQATTEALAAGATFLGIGPDSAAQVLFEESDQVDRVLEVELPTTDLELLALRNQNLVPAHVAWLRQPLGRADLARLTVAEYVRLRMVIESLRFPVLATVPDALDASGIAAVVRLGFAGLLLTPTGMTAEQVGTLVRSTREELEQTPARAHETSTVLLGGLVTPPARAPQPEPEPDGE